jgi:hypothetical protein
VSGLLRAGHSNTYRHHTAHFERPFEGRLKYAPPKPMSEKDADDLHRSHLHR